MKIDLKHREVRRQLFHLLLGVAIVLLVKLDVLDEPALLVLVILGALVSWISRTQDLPLIAAFLDHFERPEERKRFPGKGAFFLVTGSLLALALFPEDIALASIMILALGDSISHLVGRSFGRRKHPLSDTKILIGTIYGTIAGAFGAGLFVGPLEAALASLIAMTYEAAELHHHWEFLDDNVIVPLVAGVVISLLRIV